MSEVEDLIEWTATKYVERPNLLPRPEISEMLREAEKAHRRRRIPTNRNQVTQPSQTQPTPNQEILELLLLERQK